MRCSQNAKPLGPMIRGLKYFNVQYSNLSCISWRVVIQFINISAMSLTLWRKLLWQCVIRFKVPNRSNTARQPDSLSIVIFIGTGEPFPPGLGICSLIFQANHLFFDLNEQIALFQRANRSLLLFLKEQRERFGSQPCLTLPLRTAAKVAGQVYKGGIFSHHQMG